MRVKDPSADCRNKCGNDRLKLKLERHSRASLIGLLVSRARYDAWRPCHVAGPDFSPWSTPDACRGAADIMRLGGPGGSSCSRAHGFAAWRHPRIRPHPTSVPATGPRAPAAAAMPPAASGCQAGMVWRLQRNSVPSTHMRCRMTASLRASATLARCMPRRRATRNAQALSAEGLTGRVRMVWAAW